MKDDTVIELHNPADMPDPSLVAAVEEPRIKATILVPDDFLGDVLKLCQDRRGIQLDMSHAGVARDGGLPTCRSTRWCSTSTTG